MTHEYEPVSLNAGGPDATPYLEKYESSPYRRTKVRHMTELLGTNLRGQQILDFGAGGGYMSLYCATHGADVVSIEEDAAQVSKARALLATCAPAARCELIVDRTIPDHLGGRQFDVIIAKDVLEHVPDDTELMRQFARYQKPGTRLLISTQSSWSLNYWLEGVLYNRWWKRNADWFGWDDSHLRFYTPRSLRRLLTTAGYVPLRWRSTWIVPYSIVSWITLLRVKRELPALRYIDLSVGRHFPMNRLGWNLIVLAERR